MKPEDIWKEVDIRVTDQRIGMGIGGLDTIIRVHHIPSGIVVEVPNRAFGRSPSDARNIAVEMIVWGLSLALEGR